MVVAGAPTNVTLSPTESGLDLAWSAPADNGGAEISGYVVAVQAQGADVWTTHAMSGTSTTLTGLVNGTNYLVKVAAVNAAGTSSYSSTSTGTPRTVPAAVQDVTVARGSSALTVSWMAPAFDGGSPVTGYALTWTPAGGNPTTVPNVTSPLTLTGLTSGTAVAVSVRAVNAAGPGVASTPVSASPYTISSARPL